MDRRHIPFVWGGCAAKFLLQRSLVPLAPGPHGVQNGHPQTRVIDMMLMDEKGVYFLTAKGKAFYAQLMEQGYIALSAAKGKVSVSLRGKIRNIGKEKLEEIFEKNTYMQSIYPSDTRDALEVFCLYEAEGEYFDISDLSHVTRDSIGIAPFTL